MKIRLTFHQLASIINLYLQEAIENQAPKDAGSKSVNSMWQYYNRLFFRLCQVRPYNARHFIQKGGDSLGFWEARVAAGLTASEVAQILKVSLTAVFEWENGKHLPHARRLMQIAELYNCSIYDLLTPAGKPKRRKAKRPDSGGDADTDADMPGLAPQPRERAG